MKRIPCTLLLKAQGKEVQPSGVSSKKMLREGELETLLKEERFDLLLLFCRKGRLLMSSLPLVAEKGSLEVLKWVVREILPFLSGGDAARLRAKFVTAAVRGSRLDILLWLKKKRFPIEPVTILCQVAVQSGAPLNLFAFLMNWVFPFPSSSFALWAAAAGRLDLLQWIEEVQPPLAVHALPTTLTDTKENVELLTWLWERGWFWRGDFLEIMARKCNLRQFLWGKKYGAPSSTRSKQYVKENGWFT